MDSQQWQKRIQELFVAKQKYSTSAYIQNLERLLKEAVTYTNKHVVDELPQSLDNAVRVEYRREEAREFAFALLTSPETSTKQQLIQLAIEECQRLTECEIAFFYSLNSFAENKTICWFSKIIDHTENPHIEVPKELELTSAYNYKTNILRSLYAKARIANPTMGTFFEYDCLFFPVTENEEVVAYIGVDCSTKNNLSFCEDVLRIIARSLGEILLRKRTTLALRASQEMYRSTFRNAPFFFCTISQSGILRAINISGAKLFQATPEELEGRPVSELAPLNLSNWLMSQVQKRYTSANEIQNRFYINGQYLWLKTTVQLLDSSDEDLVLFISRDVTASRLAKQMLRESEDQLLSIAENTPDILIRFDEDGDILFSNENGKRVFSEKVDSTDVIEGQQTLMSDLFISLKDSIKQVMQKRTPIEKVLTVAFQDRHVFLEWRLIPEFNQQQQIETILAIGRDISGQKLNEQELIVAKEQAEQSDRLKSAFLANMSHEIRTPMNAIWGFTQLLDDDQLLPKKRNEYTQIINTNASYLLRLITDIIDLAKIESGQIELKVESVNINEEFRAVLDEFSSQLEASESNAAIKLSLELPDDKAEMRLDIIRFRQVLSNLLDNAIKFTPQGSIILGYKIQVNSELLFFVKDTGIGIETQFHDVIFERFRQAEVALLTKEFRGTGLGLAISKGLVELFGGEIWVESVPNLGSVFYFTYSYTEGGRIDTKPYVPLNSQKLCDWSGHTLLIVENSEINLFYLRELLRITNIKLIAVKRGQDAIASLIHSPQISIVLLDLLLPDLDGLEVVRVIKEHRADLPIIAQTTFAMQQHALNAIDVGCDAYIVKPIARDKLIEKMDFFLRDEPTMKKK